MGNVLARFASRLPVALLVIQTSGPTLLKASEPGTGQVILEAKGYLVAARQATISPKVSGQVLEWTTEEGKRVSKDEVLARLDPVDYQAALLLARAELKLAQAGPGKAQKEGGKADLAIARAKVEVAEARALLAQQRLDATVIRAPFEGTVLTKRAEVGTFVDPKAFNLPWCLCDLADLRTLEVDLWVGEKDVAKVRKGQRWVIRVEASPEASYRGSVARLLPVADRAKGAVGVRIRIEMGGDDQRLRPELSAIVQILDKK